MLSACDTIRKAALSIPRVESKLFPAEVRIGNAGNVKFMHTYVQYVRTYICTYVHIH